ncbi:MAG: FAD-dependent oxidoreductase, partial [Thermoanaerobaculia bacterium]|nr:FAD-dependent oxidoreductase [Thermoanaerobaculia bacterium]
VVAVGEEEVEVPAERVLVATGRLPNTDELGLELTPVRLDDGGRVIVGPDRRAARGILAIGDITAGPALAHKATAEAEVAALTVAGRPATFAPLAVPEVVFCDPEVASAGMSVAAAEAELGAARSFRFPLAASARARTLGAATGQAEVVADGDGTVVGVHLAGPGVAELAGEAALAVEMGASLEDLALTIHPHPTVSEALAEAAHGALGTPLHVSAAKRRSGKD